MLKLTRNGLNSAGGFFFFAATFKSKAKLVKDMPEPENWTNLGVKKKVPFTFKMDSTGTAR